LSRNYAHPNRHIWQSLPFLYPDASAPRSRFGRKTANDSPAIRNQRAAQKIPWLEIHAEPGNFGLDGEQRSGFKMLEDFREAALTRWSARSEEFQ
jgi:hypothetical protein